MNCAFSPLSCFLLTKFQNIYCFQYSLHNIEMPTLITTKTERMQNNVPLEIEILMFKSNIHI